MYKITVVEYTKNYFYAKWDGSPIPISGLHSHSFNDDLFKSFNRQWQIVANYIYILKKNGHKFYDGETLIFRNQIPNNIKNNEI